MRVAVLTLNLRNHSWQFPVQALKYVDDICSFAGRASKRNRDDDDADAVSMAHLAIDTSNQESVNAKQVRVQPSNSDARINFSLCQ